MILIIKIIQIRSKSQACLVRAAWNTSLLKIGEFYLVLVGIQRFGCAIEFERACHAAGMRRFTRTQAPKHPGYGKSSGLPIGLKSLSDLKSLHVAKKTQSYHGCGNAYIPAGTWRDHRPYSTRGQFHAEIDDCQHAHDTVSQRLNPQR